MLQELYTNIDHIEDLKVLIIGNDPKLHSYSKSE